MSHYSAETLWERKDANFLDNRYSRRHALRFDGGLEVPGSSSPSVVPLPMSDASALDPEEAFVSSLSSCHMLWFLTMAVKRKFCVDRYADAATGVMSSPSAAEAPAAAAPVSSLVTATVPHSAATLKPRSTGSSSSPSG